MKKRRIPTMSRTPRAQKALPRVLVLGAIAALIASAVPAGATTAAAAAVLPATRSFAGNTVADTAAQWATMGTNALARHTATSRALADPFAIAGATAVGLPSAPIDKSLRNAPVGFARAIASLHQATLVSQQIANRAFVNLTPAERATLVSHAQQQLAATRAIADQLRAAVETGDRGTIEHARDNAAVSARQLANPADAPLAARVDQKALAQAARVVTDTAAAVTPALRSAAVHMNSASPTLSCSRPGPIYCDDSNYVEVWGPEDNTYSADSVAMVRVDLGGNDTYTDHTGYALGDMSNCDPNAPGTGCLTAMAIRANIDLGGNDTYGTDLGQGVGFAGIGVLYDGGGKDSYGAFVGQGFGVVGGGVVVDVGTDDDSYGCLALCQGAGIVGAGVLIDTGGNETYGSLALSQAVAVLGAGVLVDGSGNDTYRCLAVCQASAIGGGGVLVDGSGDDSYSGLELFGIRIPGVFNDAMALLTGGVALVDLAGNDTYEILEDGFGVAESSNLVYLLTGMQQTDLFAVLYDGEGTDTYWSNAVTSFGFATGYAYARFIDKGTAADAYTSYNNPNPKNNAQWVQSDGNSTWLLGYDVGQPNGMGEDD
jgi:hypothetical protein